MGRAPTDALFDVTDPKAGPGTIYQGVCRQIRTLIQDNTIDRATHAGTIAQARSLAASLDRVSGHTNPRRQAAGMQLAAMHSQLDALLCRLAGDSTPTDDPFARFLEDLNDTPKTPHPQV